MDFISNKLDEAVKIIFEAGYVYTTLLHRKLKIRYSEASKLIDKMEELGIISKIKGVNSREILITYDEWLEKKSQLISNTIGTQPIVYYKDGLFKKIETTINYSDPKDIIYNARYINSDGYFYDLENENSIKSITVQNFGDFTKTDLGVTGNLVYDLRIKATSLKNNGIIDTAMILLEKATEMMPNSRVAWTKRDYMRYTDWLIERGKIEEAEEKISSIEKQFKGYEDLLANKVIENAKILNTDIVEASHHFCCCSECAKYRGRWFSLSGKSKVFPKKPNKYNCTCSGITFGPVIVGISTPTFCPEDIDIVAYSNRPFVDDRTDDEIKKYNKFKLISDTEIWYEQYRKRLLAYKGKRYDEYHWLRKNFPELAPKSLGGYTRMKNSNSKNFLKLTELALSKGYDIRYTDEELSDLEVLKEKTKKYNEITGAKNND